MQSCWYGCCTPRIPAFRSSSGRRVPVSLSQPTLYSKTAAPNSLPLHPSHTHPNPGMGKLFIFWIRGTVPLFKAFFHPLNVFIRLKLKTHFIYGAFVCDQDKLQRSASLHHGWTQAVAMAATAITPLTTSLAPDVFPFFFLLESTHRYPSASDSSVLGLKACTIMFSFEILFSKHKIITFYFSYSSFNLCNYLDAYMSHHTWLTLYITTQYIETLRKGWLKPGVVQAGTARIWRKSQGDRESWVNLGDRSCVTK